MSVPVIPAVIEQHVEELATLWAIRDSLCEAADIRLRDLARFDERIEAHEDGCALGGEEALRMLSGQLADTSAGRVFGAGVLGLDLNDRRTIARCLALAELTPEGRRGLTSALGWVEPARLRGFVRTLLTATSAVQRKLGLAACRLHSVNPGAALDAAMEDPAGDVRAEAIRTGGVIGRVDLVGSLTSLADEDPACQFSSAWSAVLLGNRTKALDALASEALSPSGHQRRAFRLTCQVMSCAAAQEIVGRLAADSRRIRWVIEGCGIVGDSVYVPWLIESMGDTKTARLAGEAFSRITGVKLGQFGLEGKRPEGFESGPNDDPDDPNVDMDLDEGLPWPDVTKTKRWWEANGARFPEGTRYFMGAPVAREHCIDVLKSGEQRERILAAHYLCLIAPGTPLFNTSAPARRQQRLLAAMA